MRYRGLLLEITNRHFHHGNIDYVMHKSSRVARACSRVAGSGAELARGHSFEVVGSPLLSDLAWEYLKVGFAENLPAAGTRLRILGAAAP
jgi:hypothetical protein